MGLSPSASVSMDIVKANQIAIHSASLKVVIVPEEAIPLVPLWQTNANCTNGI